MSKIEMTLDTINQLDPMAIADNEFVRERFIQIYETMWTPSTGISGEAAYERESRNFNRILAEKEDIRIKCTRFSIFNAFLDVAISGLSLEPGSRAQQYLIGRSIAVGSYLDRDGKTKKKYEAHCLLKVSGYGELVHRARLGQIRHADNPVIVYAEDEFEFGERNGAKFVNYTCRLPHASRNITACFMKITRADGSIDYAVMLPEDWQRLAEFSAKNNARWDNERKEWINYKPNALYGDREKGTTIDTGFLKAKCIKHAFSTYPKARVGKATQLESQTVDEMEITDDIYGLSDGTAVDTTTGEVKETGFAPAPDTSAGITVDPAASQESANTDDIF